MARKNQNYWDRLIRLLEWTGNSLKAARVREEVMKSRGEPTRDTLLTLAQDYEWMQAYDDSLRVYDEMRAKGPFTQTVIGVTILIDFLVIILFSINL